MTLAPMKTYPILTLIIYSFGLAVGQMLFKLGARTFKHDVQFMPTWSAALMNWPIWTAVLLYGALTALWVYILTFVELSRAYPFVALTLVVTPLGAALLFDERLTVRYLMGLAAIVSGVVVIAQEVGRS